MRQIFARVVELREGKIAFASDSVKCDGKITMDFPSREFLEVTCNYDPKKNKKATALRSGGFKIRKAYFFSSFRVMSLMTNSVPIINTIPTGRQMSQFCTKPAMMKETKETAATVIA